MKACDQRTLLRIPTGKVNETDMPIGIDTTPIFSWIPVTDAYEQYQTAYRITVSSTKERAEQGVGDLWDSGRVESELSYSIPYQGRALVSHTAYYWKVTVWDGAHRVGESPVFRFVTGILSQDEWSGEWIGIDCHDREAPRLRKEFALLEDVQEAYLSVAGLGFFAIEINGSAPDDTLLNCCNTQYSQTVLYRTFDITALLQKGANAIGVELGNSFYNEQGGVWNWATASWRDQPKMKLQLTVRYGDGSIQTILSDETWQATVDGPICFNSIYYGEIYDARKEQGGWTLSGYSEEIWNPAQIRSAPTGKLCCQLEDPIRRVKAFAPADIQRRADGSFVVFAPEMITGWARLTFRYLPAGRRITIRYGEKILPGGDVQKLGDRDGANSHWWPERAIMTDEYIAKGCAEETYEPQFSYKGYEYIQIFGYEGDLKQEDVVLYRISNDVKVSGRFECADRFINALHAMMVRTMKNNLQGKPTDTPVWEKNGWLGDLNVARETFTANFDCANIIPHFVNIMVDCFREYRILPNMVPTAGWGIAQHYVWNSVMVFAVYDLYHIYGMREYAKGLYPLLSDYANGIIRELERTNWIASDGQLGDWVSPMNSQDARYSESPNEGSGIVATAYAYKMLLTMVELAKLTGNAIDAKDYEQAAMQIYCAFNEKFYDSAEGCYRTTVWYNHGPLRTKYRQTSQLVPLAFGLVPDDYTDLVVKRLVEDIVSKDYHLDTGCVGAKEILPVLCAYGYGEIAYTILTQRTYPSWGFMLEQGATSLWEMWETTTRSRAHYFLGTYDRWLYEGLAGISRVREGYRTFTIAPFLPQGLDFVTCTQETVRGRVESSWCRMPDGSATMEITVPFGATATVVFPTAESARVRCTKGHCTIRSAPSGATALLGSGEYAFITAVDLA